MMVDLKKLSSFGIKEEKEICFDINGKKVIFEIPFTLSVNKGEKCLYIGKSWERTVDLTDEDINKILDGDDSVITSACGDFAWSLILKNRYCKE